MVKHILATDPFPLLVAKAYDLGLRMEQQGFSRGDNPYHGLNPRLAKAWGSGFDASRLAQSWFKLTNKSVPDTMQVRDGPAKTEGAENGEGSKRQ